MIVLRNICNRKSLLNLCFVYLLIYTTASIQMNLIDIVELVSTRLGLGTIPKIVVRKSCVIKKCYFGLKLLLDSPASLPLVMAILPCDL